MSQRGSVRVLPSGRGGTLTGPEVMSAAMGRQPADTVRTVADGTTRTFLQHPNDHAGHASHPREKTSILIPRYSFGRSPKGNQTVF